MANNTNKISHTQKVLMLEWLEKLENRKVLAGPSQVMPSETIKKKWQNLSDILNNCGCGPVKTSEKWRRTLTELRFHLKKKHRTILAGKKPGPPLSEVEGRFLNLFGRATMESLGEIPEIGVGEENAEAPQEREDQGNNSDYYYNTNSPANNPLEECGDDNIETTAFENNRKAMNNKNTSRLVERFESASGMQADAINNIAGAMNRIADSNEALQSSMVQMLNKLTNIVEVLAKKQQNY